MLLHCRRRLGLRLAQLPDNDADEQQREVESMRQKVLLMLQVQLKLLLALLLPGGAVPTEAPTILLFNKIRPVVQPIGPLAIGSAYGSSYVILHCLVNALPHWATGYMVRQQVGL
jgi:hypothetical protein